MRVICEFVNLGYRKIMFPENDFITFIIFHSDIHSARKMTSGSGVDKLVDSVDRD